MIPGSDEKTTPVLNSTLGNRRDAVSVRERMRQWRNENPATASARQHRRDVSRRERKLVASLTSLFEDEDLRRAHAAVVEALDATTPIILSPGKGKPPEVLQVPDHRTRLEAAKLIAAYVEGLPIARQVNIAADFKDLDQERLALLACSRAGQEALAEVEEEIAQCGPGTAAPGTSQA